MSHSNCLTQNVSQKVSQNVFLKMSHLKYFNQNVSPKIFQSKCLTQWFKMSHSMTQNVSCGSSVLLFVKTILTFPQLLVPKETIPTRYLVWSKLPRFCDIKGPPESPEQESFPIKRTIKCCCAKSLKLLNQGWSCSPCSPPAQRCLSGWISEKRGKRVWHFWLFKIGNSNFCKSLQDKKNKKAKLI